MARRYVAAEPYAWPYDGVLRSENTALIVIDMQASIGPIVAPQFRSAIAPCMAHAHSMHVQGTE